MNTDKLSKREQIALAILCASESRTKTYFDTETFSLFFKAADDFIKASQETNKELN